MRRRGRAATWRRPAPSLGEALAALAVVWGLLALRPLLAGGLGPGGATSLTFAGAAAWLLGTRQVSARAGPPWCPLVLGAAAGYASLPAWCLLCAVVALGLDVPVGSGLPAFSAPVSLLPALLLLGPVFEELLYRERLLGALAARVPAPAALLAASSAFALPHHEARLVLATFLVGLGLGAVWLLTRSLALCVGLHAGLNLAVQVSGLPPGRASLPPAAAAACGCAILGLAVRRGRVAP